jgi:hypothetical protein
VSIDEQHVALPQLYGAPAYARPPLRIPESERPFDPDELPIEAERTDEEIEFTSALPEHVWTTPGGAKIGRDGKAVPDERKTRRRKLRLRGIGGRFRGSGG